MQQFKSQIGQFNSKLWTWHFMVPEYVVKSFVFEDAKRVVCTLNGTETFQCAIMPAGKGLWFINVNKRIRTKLGLDAGSEVDVSLVLDES